MKLLIAICLLSIAISALSQNNADGSVPGTPPAAEKLEAQLQQVQAAFSERLSQSESAHQQQFAQVKETLTQKIEEVHGSVEEIAERFSQSDAAQKQQLSQATESLVRRVADVQDGLSDKLSKVESAQKEQAAAFNQKLSEVETKARAAAETATGVTSSVEELNRRSQASAEELKKYVEKIQDLTRSVETQTQVTERFRSEIDKNSQSISSLSASIKTSTTDISAKLHSSSAAADARISKIEQEVAALKEIAHAVQDLSSKTSARLEDLVKEMIARHNETTLRFTKLSGNNNVSAFADFVDRAGKSAHEFYDQNIAPAVQKLSVHAVNYSNCALKYAHEFVEYVVDFKATGTGCIRESHQTLKQKLTGLGIPAEHGDVASFSVIILGALVAALLALYLLFRIVKLFFWFLCGCKRSAPSSTPDVSTLTSSSTPSSSSSNKKSPKAGPRPAKNKAN